LPFLFCLRKLLILFLILRQHAVGAVRILLKTALIYISDMFNFLVLWYVLCGLWAYLLFFLSDTHNMTFPNILSSTLVAVVFLTVFCCLFFLIISLVASYHLGAGLSNSLSQFLILFVYINVDIIFYTHLDTVFLTRIWRPNAVFKAF